VIPPTFLKISPVVAKTEPVLNLRGAPAFFISLTKLVVKKAMTIPPKPMQSHINQDCCQKDLSFVTGISLEEIDLYEKEKKEVTLFSYSKVLNS
jgi:hypothetical protein